jgi:hypothetical protein
MKKNNELKKNSTSVAVACDDGLTRLYPLQVVKAMGMQKILGFENLPKYTAEDCNK